jgi:hypothetical protein
LKNINQVKFFTLQISSYHLSVDQKAMETQLFEAINVFNDASVKMRKLQQNKLFS